MEKKKNSTISLKWDTPKEVRKSLAKINNMVLNDKIEAKKASTMAYIANQIIASIRVDEQEKKIKKLEELFASIKAEQNNE
ncbi:MAG: hypothetical protein ACRDD7_08315 [Peptostreptococcaceae bacterium]